MRICEGEAGIDAKSRQLRGDQMKSCAKADLAFVSSIALMLGCRSVPRDAFDPRSDQDIALSLRLQICPNIRICVPSCFLWSGHKPSHIDSSSRRQRPLNSSSGSLWLATIEGISSGVRFGAE